MNNKREKLADLSHRQWSSWMVFLFEHSKLNKNGTVTIPKNMADRWKRQSKTHYIELSEEEKNSNRIEANRVIRLLNEKDLKHDDTEY